MAHFHLFFYTLLTFLALWSHGTAMFTNPGAVPREAAPLVTDIEALEEGPASGRKRRWCNRCKAFKPAKATHDSVSGRCVIKFDHYCPWVNNAIGIYNHKFFLLFVLYTFLQCAYSLFLVILRFVTCATHETGGCDQLGMLTGLVMLEAILFGLFTMCMLCDQGGLVCEDKNNFGRMKGDKHAHPTIVNEIFGSVSARGWICTYVWWFMPFPVTFPDTIRDQVLGFTVPPKAQPKTTAGNSPPKGDPAVESKQASAGLHPRDNRENNGSDELGASGASVELVDVLPGERGERDQRGERREASAEPQEHEIIMDQKTVLPCFPSPLLLFR